MAIDFNPKFPGDIRGELDTRTNSIRNRTVDWNYKKYAYINVETTGKSKTIICSKSFSIGDGSAPKSGHLGMYNTEGGIRKFKPLLESVSIFCDGGSDYTDAAIWEGTINFRVYTMADLDTVEESFFRIGAEVKVSYGWRGLSGDTNNGSIIGAVTNFSYSIDSDGSFSCTVNILSPGALWDGSLGDTVDVKPDTDDDETNEDNNIIKALEIQHKKAFGVTGDNEYKGVISGDLQIKRSSDNNFYLLGNIKNFKRSGGVFGIGWLGGTKDIYIPYITLGTFVRYVNEILKTSDSEIEEIQFLAKTQNIKYEDGFASSNPTEIVLPGEFANYGTNLNWSNQLGQQNVQSILISLPILLDAYEKTKIKKGSETFPPKISALFKEIFQKIDDLSGGLVTLVLLPEEINQNKVNTEKQKLFIANRKTVIDDEFPSPYEFKVLERGSLLKAVSLSSDFDSDAILAATRKSSKDGSSNIKPLKNLYNCAEPPPRSGRALTDTQQSRRESQQAKSDSGVLDSQRNKLSEAKENISKKGFNSEKVSSYSDAMRKYIKNNGETLGSGYKELPYNLNLSVTIDGINGMPYFAPITIDRIPTRFKSNVFFSITKIEHTFDGQGGWDTKFDTVLRLK
jgi:hypothetical protein